MIKKYNDFGFASKDASLAGAQITIKALDSFPVKGFLYLSSSRSLMPDLSELLSSVIRHKQSQKSHSKIFITFLCGLIFLGLKTGSNLWQDWKLFWIGLATTFPK
jgi:hypothetical protein